MGDGQAVTETELGPAAAVPGLLSLVSEDQWGHQPGVWWPWRKADCAVSPGCPSDSLFPASAHSASGNSSSSEFESCQCFLALLVRFSLCVRAYFPGQGIRVFLSLTEKGIGAGLFSSLSLAVHVSSFLSEVWCWILAFACSSFRMVHCIQPKQYTGFIE